MTNTLPTKEELIHDYLDNNLSIAEIAQKFHVSKLRIKDLIKNFDIKLLSYIKRKRTYQKLYGVDNNSQTEEYLKKVKKTCKEKYGQSSPTKVPAIKQKIKATCEKRYGVSSYSKTLEYKVKVKDTCQKRYGVKSYKQEHITNRNNLTKNFIEEHFSIYSKKYKLSELDLESFMTYFSVSKSTAYKYLKKLNVDLPIKNTTYKTQNTISNFIKENSSYKVLTNVKNFIKASEVDILIPSIGLGIEYDGMLWHSEGLNDIYIGLSERCIERLQNLKVDLCKQRGTHLLTIWENEWETKQDIWKSVLNSHLGLNQKIFARKCQIIEVPYKIAQKFLETSHLQGGCVSSVNIGLLYEGKLVSLMTFGKSRYNKNYQYELLRFCNKKGYTVVGGASKLLKYFERKYKPKSLVSYANRRWSNGNLYRKLDFTYSHTTKPSYHYFHSKDTTKVYSRIQFQKHKLKDLLEDFDPTLSEKENMFNNGYRCIYDCGQMVFVKNFYG